MSEETSTNESPKLEATGRFNWSRIWSAGQLLVSISLVVGLLVWLVWSPVADEPIPSNSAKPMAAIEASGYLKLSMDPESPLGKKVAIEQTVSMTVNDPIIHATGRVVASRRPGNDGKKDFWQFNSGELLDTFAAWEKSECRSGF